MSAAFAEKLRLVLKRASMSAAQLAARTEVDKSVVSRWLSGAVTPSDHNLARLSGIIAEVIADFRMIDWDRDLPGLAARIGAGDGGAPGPAAVRRAIGLPLVLLDETLVAASRRAQAYHGFYRMIRPAAVWEGVFIFEYAMIRLEEIGLLSMRMASFGAIAEGWLLPLHGQMHAILADHIRGGLFFGVVNAPEVERVSAIEGLVLGAALDAARTPTAGGVRCERIGDLTGDRAADDAHFLELAQADPTVPDGAIPEAIRTHLTPDFGPKAAAGGGDMLLRMPPAVIEDSWAAPIPAVPPVRDEDSGIFAGKLNLVLRLLSLSGGQLAAALGVHKSVVSRWLSGGVDPSPANLTRLTALISARAPGFVLTDWGRAPDDLARLFGADAAALPSPRGEDAPPAGLPLSIWEQIVANAAQRGGAYHGFYRLTRHDAAQPSPPASGAFICEHLAITPDPSGLPRLRVVTAGGTLEGWILPVHDQVYAIAADQAARFLICATFNGVGGAKVDVVDGLIMTPGPGAERAPTAMPAVCELIEDLTGDPEADEARFATLCATSAAPKGGITPLVRACLLRDGGPLASAEGGDLLLKMPLDTSLTRGRLMTS